MVISLETCLGHERNIFQEGPELAQRIVLGSPVMSTSKFNALRHVMPNMPSELIDLNYEPRSGLQQAIKDICTAAETAVHKSKIIIILTVQNLKEGKLPVPAAMATDAVHHHLINVGLRCQANLVIDTGSARDTHHFAVLISLGDTAVYPYLSYRIINDMIISGIILDEPKVCHKAYRKGINKGLVKILSKMGISTIASYRGAQLFEAAGIGQSVVSLCFTGVNNRIAGACFTDFQADHQLLADRAWKPRQPVHPGGLIKYVHGQEYHAFNPDVIQTIQRAVKTGDHKAYQCCANLVNQRSITTLRDLLQLREVKSIPLSEVEPLSAILQRFDTAAMSLGALSPEAHEDLAVAMNLLGGRSNSGKGGEVQRVTVVIVALR